MATSIRNITALKKMVAEHATAPMDDVVRAINISLNLEVSEEANATGLRRKAESHRLDAAHMLVSLRDRVEQEGHKWWDWQKDRFARGRKDIEKLLKIGRANDPEAEHEAERAKTRERMRATRDSAPAHNADVRGTPPLPDPPTQAPPLIVFDTLVESALRLLRQMTPHQYQIFRTKQKEEFP